MNNMNTQFAKVGTTYPKPTSKARKDDPWTRRQTLSL